MESLLRERRENEEKAGLSERQKSEEISLLSSRNSELAQSIAIHEEEFLKKDLLQKGLRQQIERLQANLSK